MRETNNPDQGRAVEQRKMKAVIDAPGLNTDHGYTIDNRDTIWYWKWDGENLTFRETGTGVNHPIRNGPVPEPVREYTERFIERENQ